MGLTWAWSAAKTEAAGLTGVVTFAGLYLIQGGVLASSLGWAIVAAGGILGITGLQSTA